MPPKLKPIPDTAELRYRIENHLRNDVKGGYADAAESIVSVVTHFMQPVLCSRCELTNTEVLMFATGWQGGTVHMLAAELFPDENISAGVSRIQEAGYEEMQKLCRLAQQRRNERRTDAELKAAIWGNKPLPQKLKEGDNHVD